MPIADFDTVHVAARGFDAELQAELVERGADVVATAGRLVFVRGTRGPLAWAQNTWLAPQVHRIGSIGDAARRLRTLQRNWHLHAVAQHRRAALIGARLPPIRFRPLEFPCAAPAAPLGAWTLADRDTLIASTACSSPFPDGEPAFVEDRSGPPNRAYLKLFEALTLARTRPGPGQRCVDLGAAPGGWTWVLAGLGADVLSIDRASLAPAVAAHPRVDHRRGDAFAMRPDSLGAVDWVVCDLAAYPDRVLALARAWAEAHPLAALVFTVKLQGAPDPAAWLPFLDIPGARLTHLASNRHELTWFRLPADGPPEAAAGVPSAVG